MRKIKVFLMVIAVLVLSVCYSYAGEEAKVADTLPDISLTDIKTNQIAALREISKGKPAVIVYMQTSCTTCSKELDALRAMQKSTPDINIIAISIDSGNNEVILKYIEHYKYLFTFLHDPNFTTAKQFGFTSTPATVVVGKEGKILLSKSGYKPGDEKTILGLIKKNMEVPAAEVPMPVEVPAAK